MAGSKRETATLGGGCFWCLEAAYQEIAGVQNVLSGYAGGSVENPSYAQVCSGRTGHAEVVQLTFDPNVVNYGDLLDVFFTIHDPTTLNRQGADVGTQYRSVIFYHEESQREAALEKIRELEAEGVWADPIVTEVSPAPEFFPAEEYHRNYYARNPNQGYCQVVIAPKIAKLRKQHFDRLLKRGEPVASLGHAMGKDGGGVEVARGYEKPAGPAGTRRGSAEHEGQVRPYQSEPKNPVDQGGISD